MLLTRNGTVAEDGLIMMLMVIIGNVIMVLVQIIIMGLVAGYGVVIKMM